MFPFYRSCQHYLAGCYIMHIFNFTWYFSIKEKLTYLHTRDHQPQQPSQVDIHTERILQYLCSDHSCIFLMSDIHQYLHQEATQFNNILAVFKQVNIKLTFLECYLMAYLMNESLIYLCFVSSKVSPWNHTK